MHTPGFDMVRLIVEFSIGLVSGAVRAVLRYGIAGTLALAVALMIRDLTRAPIVEPTEPPENNPYFNEPIRTEGVVFHVLAQSCRWDLGSKTDIICNGIRFAGPDLIKAHLPTSLANQLDKGADLVSIGAASFEGDLGEEKARARDRAIAMAQWIAEQREIKGSVWIINMGKFRDGCRDCPRGDTSAQRLVVLATIGHRDDADAVRSLVRLELASEAGRAGSLIPHPDNYTHFEIELWRLTSPDGQWAGRPLTTAPPARETDGRQDEPGR